MNTEANQSAAPRPDPLIDEIRAIRAELSARFGHDVRKLCEHLREVETRFGNRVIQPVRDGVGYADERRPS